MERGDWLEEVGQFLKLTCRVTLCLLVGEAWIPPTECLVLDCCKVNEVELQLPKNHQWHYKTSRKGTKLGSLHTTPAVTLVALSHSQHAVSN